MTEASSTFQAHDGDSYERLMGRWSRRLAGPFLEFAGLAEGEALLDVGCGTGSLSFALADRAGAGRVTAIDYSPVYIAHAKANDSEGRIDFRVGDACALPFDDRCFDQVLSLLMLHFVPEPLRAIGEMVRVARPGASVAAAVWDVRGGLVFNRIFFDTAALLDPAANGARARNYTRPMTRPGELAAAWRQAGLSEVVDGMLTIRMEYADFADYWAPFLGQDGPGAQYVATLSDGAREELTAQVRLAYLDGEPDGPRSYAAVAWAVKGRVPN